MMVIMKMTNNNNNNNINNKMMVMINKWSKNKINKIKVIKIMVMMNNHYKILLIVLRIRRGHIKNWKFRILLWKLIKYFK